MLSNKRGINLWEVIDAAKSKPYGFQAFYPSPGLVGHCIPLDPYYLSWKSREFGFHTSMIESSMIVNDRMPEFCTEVEDLEKKMNYRIFKMKKENFESNQEIIDLTIDKIYTKYKSNEYFQEIYDQNYDEYKESKRVGKAEKCLNINSIYGVLSAYKLFYVGCSRARKDLAIFIDNEKVKEDKEKLIKKFQEIGFEVIEC